MSTLQRTSGKLSSLMRDLWVTQACNAGVQLTGDILRLKWRDFEKLAGIPEDEQLVPNGFYGAKIGGTCWVEEEWDLMVGKPFLCRFTSMTCGTILLKYNPIPFCIHLLVKVLQNTLQYLFSVPGSVHPTTLPSWILQYNQWPLPSLHDAPPDHDMY